MLVALLAAAALSSAAAPASESPQAGPAAAPAAAPGAAGPTASPPNEGDKVICKYEKQTGSKFSKKVCRTQRAIEHEQDESRKTVMGIQHQGGLVPANKF